MSSTSDQEGCSYMFVEERSKHRCGKLPAYVYPGLGVFCQEHGEQAEEWMREEQRRWRQE